MQLLFITLLCGIPMFILCYNLIRAGEEKADYGTNHLPDPPTHIDGTITIGGY